MKKTFWLIWLLCGLLRVREAQGHGFQLSVDNYFSPSQLIVTSQSEYLDPNNITPGYPNLFIEDFDGSPTAGSNGSYYNVIHGFAQTSGSFPYYQGATFNVVSPLLYSDGVPNGPNNSVVAQLASSGSYIYMYDRDYGNVADPGATNGTLSINGNQSFFPGFGVSLYDAHEIDKELYVAPGFTQTYGEYGFGYTVTVPFGTLTNGVFTVTSTVTSPVMVDVFALTDPNLGDFADNAPYLQQDAATLAIYNAIIVPEPTAAALAVEGAALALALIVGRRLRSRLARGKCPTRLLRQRF